MSIIDAEGTVSLHTVNAATDPSNHFETSEFAGGTDEVVAGNAPLTAAVLYLICSRCSFPAHIISLFALVVELAGEYMVIRLILTADIMDVKVVAAVATLNNPMKSTELIAAPVSPDPAENLNVCFMTI
jgi:hypothetical protein